ncbi:hypothetical protein [Paenibacillus dendritiformis]|uniref:hypothetical protein n=1 Tax=Paenibacillus dendritiformis TaxID=130049 RepID=UPI001300C9B6|nr:hypothetical protein [Paenibacillus dendritiformis]
MNTVMLVDTSEDNMPLFYEAFAAHAEVFHMETENWKICLRSMGEFTPYAYVLNADRTIACMGHVGEVTTTKGTIAQLGLMPVVEEVSRS